MSAEYMHIGIPISLFRHLRPPPPFGECNAREGQELALVLISSVPSSVG